MHINSFGKCSISIILALLITSTMFGNIVASKQSNKRTARPIIPDVSVPSVPPRAKNGVQRAKNSVQKARHKICTISRGATKCGKERACEGNPPRCKVVASAPCDFSDECINGLQCVENLCAVPQSPSSSFSPTPSISSKPFPNPSQSSLTSPSAPPRATPSVSPVLSPGRCRNDLGCVIEEICLLDDNGTFIDFDRLGSCSPPLPEGADCQYTENACQKGLRCSAGGTIGESSCAQKGKVGDQCYRSINGALSEERRLPNPCEDGLICTISGSCSPPAGLGETCFGNNCADGLYCDDFTEFTCKPSVNLGQECPDTVGRPVKCINGYCVFDNDEKKVICSPLKKEDEKCTFGRIQCEGDLLCSSGRDGVCVRPENLLVRRNLPCDPEMDRCDGERDLVCESQDTGAVCRSLIF